MSDKEKTIAQDLPSIARLLAPCWQVHTFDSVASTMDKARELAGEVTSEAPLLVIAASQDSGRGRQGRGWASSPGGFYATYAFLVSSPVSSLSGLPLVAGVVVQKMLSRLGATTRLKWPNDLLSLDGKKVAGILVELLAREGRSIALVGIGINLNSEPEDVPQACSVKTLSAALYTPSQIAAELSEDLRLAWQTLQRHGFGVFRSSWEANACWLGEEIEVHQGVGSVCGMFEGITDSGSLRLMSDGSMQEVLCGDVLRVRQKR